jgi:hypothetical protein
MKACRLSRVTHVIGIMGSRLNLHEVGDIGAGVNETAELAGR